MKAGTGRPQPDVTTRFVDNDAALSLCEIIPPCRHPREAAFTELRIVEVTRAEERALVAAIRVAVFVEEQRIPLAAEFDLDDLRALHVLAYCHAQPVGTGRAVLFANEARIGRLAVVAAYRRCGVGTALLRHLAAYCAAAGARRIVLHAQVHAISFYQRLGFAVVSSLFEEEGIPHCRMERRI